MPVRVDKCIFLSSSYQPWLDIGTILEAFKNTDLVPTLKDFGVTGNFRSALGDAYAQPKLRITSLHKCINRPTVPRFLSKASYASLWLPCPFLPQPACTKLHFLFFPKSDLSYFEFCPFRAMLSAHIHNKRLQPCSLERWNPNTWLTGRYFWPLEQCVCETVTSQVGLGLQRT